MIGYGITLKVSKSNYKICNYFMGSGWIFQILYVNVLNYRYFHTGSSNVVNIKTMEKQNKKVQQS